MNDNGFRNPLDEPVADTANWFRDQLDFGRQAVRMCCAALLIFLLGSMTARASKSGPAERKDSTNRLFVITSSSIQGQLVPDGLRAGLARSATLYDSLRDCHENTLVLDAGDFTPRLDEVGEEARDERWRRAVQTARTLRRLGYQAWTPGETELFLGRDGLDRIAKEMGGVVVSANLRDSLGAEIFPASLVMTIGGMRVGVTGVTDPSYLAHHPNEDTTLVDDFRLLDPDSTLAATVGELRGKVDAIICLAHLGAGGVRRLGATVPGITAFVAGHRPGFMPSADRAAQEGPGRLVPIIRAGDRGFAAGLLELETDPDLGVVTCKGKSLSLDKTVREEPSLADSIRVFEEREAARHAPARTVRH